MRSKDDGKPVRLPALRGAMLAAAIAVAAVLALSPGPASAAGCKTEYEAPTAAFSFSPISLPDFAGFGPWKRPPRLLA